MDLAALPIASDLVDLIEEDLDRLRLGSFGALVSLDHVYDPWITDRGRRFLDWLSVV